MRPIRDVLADCDRIREPEQWCSPEKVETLVSMIYAMRPNRVVEIGVWRGGSFLPMALAMRALDAVPCRKIIGIDPYQSMASAAGQVGENATWWASVDHATAFERLRTKLVELELHAVILQQPGGVLDHPELVEIWNCPSSVPTVDFTIDILHVDGNHGEQAVADVLQYAPAVVTGGIVILDDIGWTGGHVGSAGRWLESDGFVARFDLAPGRVYQRVEKTVLVPGRVYQRVGESVP